MTDAAASAPVGRLRTRRQWPILIVIALICMAAPKARVSDGGDRQSASVLDLLTSYTRRAPGFPEAFQHVEDLDAARKELDRLAPKFLDVDPPDARRRWLVTFALELAQARSEKQAVSAVHLTEWACRYVRRHDPQDEFDRRWQLAATALIEGAINPAALDAHLRHIAEQYPNEPRFALGRALVAEQHTAPREILGRTSPPPARGPSSKPGPTTEWFREEAARRYQDVALAVESVRAEANIRRAHVHLELKRHDDALLALAKVESQTRDPTLIFLSRLFRGLALEGLGKTTDAAAAFRSALEIGPGAHSATMALATLLFRTGDRAAAAALTSRLVAKNDPRADAWWAYWAGDYRFWYPLIDGVRQLLP